MPIRCCTMLANAASSSLSLLALRTTICLPREAAAACAALISTVRIVWIHEKSDDGALRHKGMQQLQSLGHCCRTKYSHTSRIAARPAEAIYQTFLDRITKHAEHDRNCLSSRFGDLRRRVAPGRDEYGDLSAYQISCQLRQSIIVTLSPTILDGQFWPSRITRFPEA